MYNSCNSIVVSLLLYDTLVMIFCLLFCLPFTVDDNRVVLEDLDAAPGHDYINASFITGYYNRVEFIVTQHPLHSTLEDFWNMIVERKVKCIVMFGPLGNKEVHVATMVVKLKAIVGHFPIIKHICSLCH